MDESYGTYAADDEYYDNHDYDDTDGDTDDDIDDIDDDDDNDHKKDSYTAAGAAPDAGAAPTHTRPDQIRPGQAQNAHPIRAVKLSIGQGASTFHCLSSGKSSGSIYML